MHAFQLEAEMRLIVKLHALNIQCDAFEGDTTCDKRAVIVGNAIRQHQVGDVLFTVSDGKQVTIAQQFLKAYGEDVL